MGTPEEVPETNTEVTKPPRSSGLRKAVAFVVTALIMGVAANAVWSEIAPPRGWSHRWLLNLITLGLTKRQNAIFQEAARGLTEQSSDATVYVLTFLFCTAAIVGVSYLKWSVSGLPKPRKNIITAPATQRMVLNGGLLVIAALFALSMLNIQDKIFAHMLSMEFRQVVTILKPYLEVKEVERLEADFANMRNEGDLKKIGNQIRSVAAKNHMELPDPPSLVW